MLIAPAVEERVGADKQRCGPQLGQWSRMPYRVPARCSRAGYGFAARRREQPPERLSIWASLIRTSWVHEHGDQRGVRNDLAQQPQPLWLQRGREHVHTCDVAAGSAKAVRKTQPDRITAAAEDNRNCYCRRLSGERRGAAGGGDHAPPAGERDQPPAPEVDRFDLRPSGIRSPRCGPRQ